MANNVIPLPQGFAVRAVGASPLAKQAADELAGGITGGFGLITIRGKVWRTKVGGVETVLTRPDDGSPRASLELVIIKAAPNLSKNWYEKGYEEGSNAAPDCYSTNGVRPEPDSPKLQNPVCQTCKWNQFGSGTGKGKACADSKRLAVVPADDIDNEVNGGPMLLRVPADSLQPVAQYAGQLKQAGYAYCEVATRIQFDPNVAHPKFVLGAIKPLSAEDAARIVSLRDDPRVSRILEAREQELADDTPVPPAVLFEQPPAPPAPPQAAPVAPAPKPAPTPAAAPVGEAVAPAAPPAPKPKTAKQLAAEAAAEAARLAAEAAAEEDEDAGEEAAVEVASAPVAASPAAPAAPVNAKAAAAKPRQVAPAAPPPPATDDNLSATDDFESALESLLDA